MRELQYHSKVQTSLENLSDEILFKMFRYLSVYDILRNISLVSKKFYEISKDPFLIESFEIDDQIIEDEKSNFLKFIHHLKSLNKLVIHSEALKSEQNLQDFVLGPLNISSKLKKLELHLSSTNIILDPLFNAENGKNIQYFKLTSIWSHVNLDSKNLIKLAKNWKNLKSLYLDQEMEFNEDALIELFEKRGPYLKHLTLGFDITSYKVVV